MTPFDDLDALVSALDAARGDAPPSAGKLDEWLRIVAARDASDLLLVAGEPPVLRVHGRLLRADSPPIDGVDVEELVLGDLPPHAQRAYREHGIADASRRFRAWPVPHQPAPRARPCGGGDPHAAEAGADAGVARPAARHRAAVAHPARPGHRRRRHGVRQDDDGRRARRRDQPARREAHPDDRGSDRIRAHEPEEHRPAGGNRRRRAGLSDRAAIGAASGAGRTSSSARCAIPRR